MILAGGKGTRLSEETAQKPKPMVLIGGKPMLWHIMKIYSFYGINEFIVCLGYKGEIIKQFFAKHSYKKNKKNSTYFKNNWQITLVDTGENTETGGRLKRVRKYLDNQTFCFTYGDTLNNVNIGNLINFHRKHRAVATVTVCIPPEKYGVLKMRGAKVVDFREKPNSEKNWVNGGFFVLEPSVFNLLKNDKTIWEKEPMQRLAKKGHLFAYKHRDFYQMMDTLREKNLLNQLWNSDKAPWKVW